MQRSGAEQIYKCLGTWPPLTTDNRCLPNITRVSTHGPIYICTLIRMTNRSLFNWKAKISHHFDYYTAHSLRISWPIDLFFAQRVGNANKDLNLTQNLVQRYTEVTMALGGDDGNGTKFCCTSSGRGFHHSYPFSRRSARSQFLHTSVSAKSHARTAIYVSPIHTPVPHMVS